MWSLPGICLHVHRRFLLTVACRPVWGTLQRTATSWLCLQVYSGTCLWRHSVMERSRPVHCTLFMWMGPVPAGGGHIGVAFPVHTLKLYVEMSKLDTNWSMEGKSMFTWVREASTKSL